MVGDACGRGCVWQVEGHAWQGVAVGVAGGMARGMHGRGCAWRGACVAGGVCGRQGHVWQGDMCGKGCVCAWQERRPLQRTVRTLLECILVVHFFFFLCTSLKIITYV